MTFAETLIQIDMYTRWAVESLQFAHRYPNSRRIFLGNAAIFNQWAGEVASRIDIALPLCDRPIQQAA